MARNAGPAAFAPSSVAPPPMMVSACAPEFDGRSQVDRRHVAEEHDPFDRGVAVGGEIARRNEPAPSSLALVTNTVDGAEASTVTAGVNDRKTVTATARDPERKFTLMGIGSPLE